MIYFYGFVAKNILNPDYKCHRKKVRYQIIIHFTRMDKSKQAKPPNSGINRFYRCLMREFWGTIIGRHKKCCLNFCSVIQNVKNKHAWNSRSAGRRMKLGSPGVALECSQTKIEFFYNPMYLTLFMSFRWINQTITMLIFTKQKIIQSHFPRQPEEGHSAPANCAHKCQNYLE